MPGLWWYNAAMEEHILQKVEHFFSQYKSQLFRKGELLIRADEDPLGIFYLRSGRIKEYVISRKGEEVVVNVFRAPSFFPMSWALNETENVYYFEAVSDAKVWRAPKSAVLEFLHHEPDVLFDLLKRVYRGTDGLITRMTHLMAGNAHTRLMSELLIHAKRFGDQKNDTVSLVISEKDLAAFTGMTRETVSRELKLLKKQGVVMYAKNTLTIPAVSKLEKQLQYGV